MFSLSKRRKAALRALGEKVPLKGLPDVRPLLLLQMVMGLSQILNGGAAQYRAVARALVRDGEQRLRELGKAAPHIELSLGRLLSRICSSEMSDDDLSDEESAAQAVLEMCLGLMLHWLSRRDDRSYPHVTLGEGGRLFALDVPSHPRSSLHPLFRARSCLIS
jgi:hypothetical protein